MGSKEEKLENHDLEHLQELYQLMLDQGLDSLELKEEDLRIRLSRRLEVVVSHAPHAARHAPHETVRPQTPAAIPEPLADHQSITSPLAGVFYRASSPTSAPFVKEGDVVDAGQTLCLVEAMKVMNEIKAEAHCRIVTIKAENSRPVTAGQILFLVEPA